MERNARDVRKYYQRNKQSVYLRKALKRCRETGAIPTVEAVLKRHLPMLPIWASFADWAGQTTNWRKRRVQHAKLKERSTALMSAKQPPNLYIPMGLGRKEYLVIEQHMKKQLFNVIENDHAPEYESSEYSDDDELSFEGWPPLFF